MPSPHIAVRDLSVARGGRTIINSLTFTASPGDRVAIVGENGRGKTTLLHTLLGELQPTAGEVTVVGGLAIARQQMDSPAGLTVGDAVDAAVAESVTALERFDAAAQQLAVMSQEDSTAAEAEYARALAHVEQLDAWDAGRRVTIALKALGAVADRNVELRHLSVGQRYRVRLACLLGGTDEILLLDEPTNHLDHEALAFLTEKLRTRNGVVIVVSHDRALLRDIATTIIDLDPSPDGRPGIYGDGFAGYVSGRAALLRRWRQAFDEEQERRRELEAQLAAAQSRVSAAWRPPKGTGKHTRATRAPGLVQAVRRRQDQVDAHAVTVPVPPLELNFPELPSRRGARLISATDVTVANRLEQPVSLTVRGGGRYVITGRNGAGKTTLLSVLAGTLSPSTGTVERGAGGIAVLNQEHGAHDPRFTSAAVSMGLLHSEEAHTSPERMSMGQRRRLDLAALLAQRPRALLLDEPTNHLSMRLVDELTSALSATQAAVVIVTHDRQLLRDTAEWQRIELE